MEIPTSRSAAKPDETSQAQFAYEGLRRLVREGRFKFGELVSEQALAEEVGVGRTPIREAVSRLAHEGLLHRIAKRGVMIRPLDLDEMRDLYDVREVMEVLCVQRAVQYMTDADVERLASTIEAARHAVETGCTWLDYRAFDRRFHEQLWTASRNKRIIAYLDSLHDASILDLTFQRGIDMPAQGQTSIREHTAIYEAIAARDADAAAAAASQHARSYQKVLTAQIIGDRAEVRR
ncbi:GntR family transcriptional regulator [Dactylosporangium sp. CA-233914]|uniref:GntR family transcriptional regulator n=1 Tax=Dactylosporangium sp. CA-233914 TaxID=3239934 RepID=UPI003D901459